MSGSCRFDSSVVCPFRYCIAGSIERCNVKSGRFTARTRGSVSGVANPVVLSPSKYIKRRVVS